MASSYTTRLRLTKQGTGDNPNTWGSILNSEFTDLIDEAVGGSEDISLTAGNVTLTSNNGSSDQARNMILRMTGTPTANRVLTVPAVEKMYIVDATPLTTGSTYTVAITPSGGGTAVTINGNDRVLVYCNGTNMYLVAQLVQDTYETSSISTSAYQDDSVTYGKIQNVSTGKRILANTSVSAGNIEEVALTSVLDMLTSVSQGCFIYRNATEWVVLAPASTSSMYLKSNGPAANPEWVSITPAGTALVSTINASATTEAAFTSILDSTYSVYELDVLDWVPSTDQTIKAQFQIGGAWVSAASYTVAGDGRDSQGNPAALEATSVTAAAISNILNSTSTDGVTMYLRIPNPSHSKSTRVGFEGYWQQSGTSRQCRVDGMFMNSNTNPVTGIRLFPDTGTFSATLKLRGKL